MPVLITRHQIVASLLQRDDGINVLQTQYFLPFDGNCIYNLSVEIAFDLEKNERNLRERGLSFELAAEFDFETAVTTEDTRCDYGERRFRSFGFIGPELHALVFTVRGDANHQPAKSEPQRKGTV